MFHLWKLYLTFRHDVCLDKEDARTSIPIFFLGSMGIGLVWMVIAAMGFAIFDPQAPVNLTTALWCFVLPFLPGIILTCDLTLACLGKKSFFSLIFLIFILGCIFCTPLLMKYIPLLWNNHLPGESLWKDIEEAGVFISGAGTMALLERRWKGKGKRDA